jgi:copper(I)-binding protein
MTKLALLVAVTLACLAMPAQAADVIVGSLTVSSAWTRATPKGAPVGAGYLTITNNGAAPDRLVGGTSDIAARFEIHEMTMDNGVMRMRPIAQGLEIKPGETAALKPGGSHVMFVGLKSQLMQGQHVKATLTFEKAGKVDVDFTVEGIGAMNANEQTMDNEPTMHDMSDMKMHGH